GPGTPGRWWTRSLRPGWNEATADAAAEYCLRSFAATSALGVPATEAAVFTLHAGDGRAHHGNSERPVSQSRGSVHVYSQRRQHEKSGNDHLCRRLDAT